MGMVHLFMRLEYSIHNFLTNNFISIPERNSILNQLVDLFNSKQVVINLIVKNLCIYLDILQRESKHFQTGL